MDSVSIPSPGHFAYGSAHSLSSPALLGLILTPFHLPPLSPSRPLDTSLTCLSVGPAQEDQCTHPCANLLQSKSGANVLLWHSEANANNMCLPRVPFGLHSKRTQIKSSGCVHVVFFFCKVSSCFTGLSVYYQNVKQSPFDIRWHQELVSWNILYAGRPSFSLVKGAPCHDT